MHKDDPIPCCNCLCLRYEVQGFHGSEQVISSLLFFPLKIRIRMRPLLSLERQQINYETEASNRVESCAWDVEV